MDYQAIANHSQEQSNYAQDERLADTSNCLKQPATPLKLL
jgi:hypothetical protein